MGFKPNDPDSNCRNIRIKLCAEALQRVRDRQALELQRTGRMISKGLAANYLLQGK
jgi:hypothetical protein